MKHWKYLLLLFNVLTASGSLIDFKHFWTSDEINTYIGGIQTNSTYSKKILTSFEHRDIWSVEFSQRDQNFGKKPMIVVEAGLRARDWIANMAALRLVKKLIDNSTMSDHVDWVVLPNINPDGYEYTRTTDRNWIKNRRSELSNATSCAGVSLNRNFDFNWAGSASSMDFCSDYYAGPWPMSEKELEALNTVFSTYDKRIKAYVSLQTAGSYILSPYFYTNEIKPDNWQKQENLGEKMREAVFNKTGEKYENLPANQVFKTSGNSLDYYSMIKSTPFPYTILLPNAKSGEAHEHTEAEIIPISQQVLTALAVLGEYIGANYCDHDITEE